MASILISIAAATVGPGRADFAGAPDILALGHGHEQDGMRENYVFDSYFDDLIVTRLSPDK